MDQLKNLFGGQLFGSNEVISCVNGYFEQLDVSLYKDYRTKLEHRCEKCISFLRYGEIKLKKALAIKKSGDIYWTFLQTCFVMN